MLGERLKELRGKRTQKEIAKILGMSRSSLTQYESGKIEPNMDNLKKLADIYRVSVDYLLGREEESVRIAEEKEFYQTMQEDPDDEFFVDGYLNATEEEKKMVRKFWRDHIWKKRK